MKQMQESSGAKIIIRGKGSQKEGAPPTGHPDDEDELHINIEGSDEAIDRALKEIEPLLFNPEQAMRVKQEQLKNLAEINGGPPSSSGMGLGMAFNTESIYGAGFKAINSNPQTGINSQPGVNPQAGGVDYEELQLQVPNPMVGLVIGKGGENILKMQSQTGVQVQIAKEQEMRPGETLRSIVLKGRHDAVLECKRMIDEIISNRQQQAPNTFGQPKFFVTREMDHAFVVKVQVPNDKVGVIIGKGGMTIKSIQERSRAQIQIPSNPDEDNPNLRTLSIGADSKEAVDMAQTEISNALAAQAMGSQLAVTGPSQYQPQQQSFPSTAAAAMYLTVPDDKVGVIIGKGGVTIKEIQNRTRVKITIPQTSDPGSNPPVRTCRLVLFVLKTVSVCSFVFPHGTNDERR
jgi:far upstream element-binding protein